MDGMGGMYPENRVIARAYWYTIAGAVGLLASVRIISFLQSRHRQRRQESHPHTVPSRPRSFLGQKYATWTAIFRELSYSQPVHFTGRISKFFTPLPIGHWLLLALYWVFILTGLWSNAIISDNSPMALYKWEKVGYRAAWVSVTQIPFIYLLSTKMNPISCLTGISYERLNWLHRWAARTVFLTVIVHWSYFWRYWVISGIVEWQVRTMTSIVTYGFASWGVLGWLVLSGFGFFRALKYELWVAQHIIAGWLLLWLLYVHVPAYARYNVWMAVAFIVFDRAWRFASTGLRNLHLMGKPRLRMPGYSANFEALPGEMVRVTIEDVDFSWRAGQHAFLSVPRLRPFESHPFTIANAPSDDRSDGGQGRLSFLVQARAGFSRSLHDAAVKAQDNQYRAFLSGPWGTPPDLQPFETVVLVACSSGASFVMPLLQDLVRTKGCVKDITLHWIIRSEDHFSWLRNELLAVAEKAQLQSLALRVIVHVTGSSRTEQLLSDIELKELSVQEQSLASSDASSASDSTRSVGDEKSGLCHSARSTVGIGPSGLFMKHGQRPSLDSMVRTPVEAALGETAVVVCGGAAITAQTRTYVAALSDERAVHKGTGAQGIFLHVETYGW